MSTADPAQAVALARIRLALRRATGKLIDVEAILNNPLERAASIAAWRSLGLADLNHLLDQYEHGASGSGGAAGPSSPGGQPSGRVLGASSARGGVPNVPSPSPGQPAAPSPDPDAPKPPPDGHYIRGAR